ncbi:MAG: 50S ribosomal protein L24 [Marinilabiliales bacterium]|nr:MAG: 50S ribosomal protein L24 [Marinilabiliales bacterium]
MATKLKIKKGDTVVVISGNSKGSQGRVLEVFPKKETAIVEGVNIMSRHLKAGRDAQNKDGGIIKKESPIRMSKLMLVDNSGTPTRVGRKVTEDGNIVRISKKSGEEIK